MRKTLGVLFVFLLLSLLALTLACFWAQRALTDAGVHDLRWQELGWQRGGVQFGQISFAIPTGQVAVEQLHLVPGWRDGPRLRAVQVSSLQLSLKARADSSAGASAVGTGLAAPELWLQLLNWLPDQVAVDVLRVELPCQAGLCELGGSLQVQRRAVDLASGQPVQASAELVLQAGEHLFLLKQQVQADGEQLQLQGDLLINQQVVAQIESHWLGRDQWRGSLQVPDWPETTGLYEYLGNWVTLGSLPVSQFPPGAQLALDWDMHALQAPVDWVDWLAGRVALDARLALPEPLSLAGWGDLSGELVLTLSADQGRWQVLQSDAQLTLARLQLTDNLALPGDLQPEQLQLQVSPASGIALAAGERVPFHGVLGLSGARGLNAQLAGDMALLLPSAQQQDWQLQLLDSVLDLQLARWQQQDVRLRDLHLAAPMSGTLDRQGVQLQAASTATLAWSELQLSAADLGLRKASMQLKELNYAQHWQESSGPSVGSQLSGIIGQLHQPQLKLQPWRINGHWRYTEGALTWQGSVRNAAELALDTDFKLPATTPWQAKATLQPIFFRAANPLAETLVAWPPLLSLSSGQLNASLSASGSISGSSVQGEIGLSGVKGIYDRSAFSGLTMPVAFKMQGGAVQLSTSALTLESLNPGLEMGPLTAGGSYSAQVDYPMSGRLQLNQLQLQLLGGQVNAEPGELDFAAPEQRLAFDIRGLELDTLFAVYPTEGLSGRGTLDGRLPAVLRDGELMIDAGAVAAREPGGVLRYQSDKLQRLAQSNAGMRQLAGALDNFHYTVLSSQVDYAEDGTLQLGLNLQGSNPNFQQGRQVNLNVNLEENIPALLTSLQLSSQVSDIIEQRVQERLLKQRLQPNKE
tara:strand:- start:1819 stop:4413 length:2595 start_codon:yes stop_codon:yes gene_type:complete